MRSGLEGFCCPSPKGRDFVAGIAGAPVEVECTRRTRYSVLAGPIPDAQGPCGVLDEERAGSEASAIALARLVGDSIAQPCRRQAQWSNRIRTFVGSSIQGAAGSFWREAALEISSCGFWRWEVRFREATRHFPRHIRSRSGVEYGDGHCTFWRRASTSGRGVLG